MNAKFKYLIAFGFLICLLFVQGCKENPPTTGINAEAGNKKDSLPHEIIPGNVNVYRMKISSNPDIIEAGKRAVVSLTPQIVGKETDPVPLDVDHGYEMHLILVNNDLSWFDLRHPGLADLGTYEQPYTFSKGGVYLLFAEYKPTGGKDTVQMRTFAVNGNSVPNVIYAQPKMTSIAGPYEVSLSLEGNSVIESGMEQTIEATITKDGVPVDATTLGDYLGGKGHMVIISVKEKEFLNVYPVPQNDNLLFHVTLSKPGLFRTWLQFQVENVVYTADFVIKAESSGTAPKDQNE